MAITLPCGHVIEPQCDIATSYNGGHNSHRVAQTQERIRIITEMLALGYTRAQTTKLTGIPRKAIERMVERRQLATPPRKTQPLPQPSPLVDPIVAAFWEKWDARHESSHPAKNARRNRPRLQDSQSA